MVLQKPNLSVVVPVFRCRDTLKELAEQVFSLEPEIGLIELIFVDDASVDGSWPIIETLSETYSGLKSFRLPANRGQHYAQHFGVKQASADRVVMMDCDLENSPSDIPVLLRELRSNDYVVSSSRDRGKFGWFRRLVRKIYGLILAATTGHESFKEGKISFSFCALGSNAISLIEARPLSSLPLSALLLRSDLRWCTCSTISSREAARPSSYRLVDNVDIGLQSLIFSGRGLRMLLIRVLIGNFLFFLITVLLIFGQLLIRGSLDGWYSLLLFATTSIFLSLTNLVLLMYVASQISEVGSDQSQLRT
jgi:glycosyltransferase involved in cell wall biosynthesis